jgi:hypothetical protein
LRVGARERVDDVDRVEPAEVVGDLGAQVLVVLERELTVDRAPPDPILRLRLANRELVLRRASRVNARVDDERAAFGDARLVAKDRVLVEERRRRVAVERARKRDPMLAEVDLSGCGRQGGER